MYCRKTNMLRDCLLLLIWFFSPILVDAQDFTKGQWLKLYIPKEGLQKIDYNWFKKNNISPENINTQKIAILIPIRFPSQETEHAIDTTQFTSIQQIPTLAFGLNDQQFNLGDYLTFPVKFPFNSYSDSTFCLINLDALPSKWVNKEAGTQKTNAITYAYREETYQEEKYNFLQSGKLWVSEPFYMGETKKINLPCEGAINTPSATLQTTVYVSSIQKATLGVNAPNLSETLEFESISGDRYDKKANFKTFQTNVNLGSACKTYEISLQFKGPLGSATVGKTSLIYPKTLTSNQNNWLFWPKNAIQVPSITCQIPDAAPTQDIQIWQLKDKSNITCTTPTNGFFEVNNPASSSILLADSKLAFEPIFVEKISSFNNQLANNTTLLIICPKEFSTAANQFAQFKNENKIPSEVRTLENILHEYTAGSMSLPALKAYLYQQKKLVKTLKYVLLLSDASVDVKEKNALSSLEKQWRKIPTYESFESLFPLNSYASDDYLGILEDLAGNWDLDFSKDFQMSLAIGRLPARTPNEAQLMVNKLIAAQKKESKTSIALVADDEDFNIHVTDAEFFATYLHQKAPYFPIQKIYLDAFPLVKNSTGYTSSAASKKIIQAFNQDVGFIHFMGHGSENGWTDEKIFTTKEITALNNRENLPFLLTATCQFAKFDNPYILSGAEALLSSDKGGVQAIVGTSRPVFQSNNFSFGKNWYAQLVQNLHQTTFRLGDLVRAVKNESNNTLGNRNIVLLGDPSSPLPWVGEEVKVTANNFTWGQPNTVTVTNKDKGALTLWLAGEETSTLGTKTPKYTYQGDERLIYQKYISSRSNSNLVTIPAIKNTDQPELLIRFQGTTQAGFQKATTLKQVVETKDMVGPNVQQLALNRFEFIISDSSGIGYWGKNKEEAVLVINDTIQIPWRAFVNSLENDKISTITLDPNLFKEGENKVSFKLYDLLQNESNFTFSVTKKPENDSDITLFPNPFKGECYLQFNKAGSWTNYRYKLQLFDLSGRKLDEIQGELGLAPVSIQLQARPQTEIILCLIEIIDPITRFSKTYLSRLISSY